MSDPCDERRVCQLDAGHDGGHSWEVSPPAADPLDVERLWEVLAGIGVLANGTWVRFEREDMETIAAEYARLARVPEGEQR